MPEVRLYERINDMILYAEPAMVTLSNDKVYIGFIRYYDVTNWIDYNEKIVVITPILSGYRKADTKELVLTTEYPGKETSTASPTEDVIIFLRDIITVTTYNEDLANHFEIIEKKEPCGSSV